MKSKNKAVLTLFLLIVSIFLISVFLAGCSNENSKVPDQSEEQTDTEIKVRPQQGYLAPNFELEDLSGEKVTLSSLRDKTVVLNFWSTGCKFCLQEMPDFDEFNRSKPEDVVVLMINLDKDRSRLSTYIENLEYSFTVLIDERAETARSYLIRGVPTTFVVGKDGVVRHRVEGVVTRENLNNLVVEEPYDESPLST